ncbi:helix-turn-helix domain-containing protein [Aeoliella mucimassa]|uniref:Uncharacterized protein n=1 Tax=Aeoliella mucimassa TaxID=2527972 RepID=A0A518ARN7_9BACT|nr:helix-turn-helix domain-containing protein [Aeoliella mucimassa]QDU57385.1 hypothetical protein Pan181_36000 [Aeoliella mucimassa]
MQERITREHFNRIKRELDSNNGTQRAIAERLGVSPSTVHLVARGCHGYQREQIWPEGKGTDPSPEEIARHCEAIRRRHGHHVEEPEHVEIQVVSLAELGLI